MTTQANSCEREYEFTLILTGISEFTDEASEALFKAGCDDATLAVRCGRPLITFARTAPSLKHAILSAITDVKRSNTGAKVLRVDYCNLVTQADIARRIGRTRQLVHQYMSGARGPGGFPGPVCDITEGTPLWMWCEVAYWLWQNDMIKEDSLREASEVEAINSVLDFMHWKRIDYELTEELLNSIACDS